MCMTLSCRNLSLRRDSSSMIDGIHVYTNIKCVLITIIKSVVFGVRRGEGGGGGVVKI